MPSSRVTVLIVAGILATAMAVEAQAPRTEAGARAAAMEYLNRFRGMDTARVAPSYAAMNRDFVTCRELNGKSICALTDNRPVTVVDLRLVAPDTASVDARVYIMLTGTCPGGRVRIDPPIIANVSSENMTFAYANGKWNMLRQSGISC